MNPVRTDNEWGPLQEVIVGHVDGAVFPSADPILRHTFPPDDWDAIQHFIGIGGMPYASEVIEAARANLADLVRILEGAGVKVRRPDAFDFKAGFQSPLWSAKSGFSASNPRDPFLVVGDQIIETPMADRNRYFETFAYRTLLSEYSRAGARWISAPKPILGDDSFESEYKAPSHGEKPTYVTTEAEPLFDGADFVRCGKDLFGQRSHVTNFAGVDWLRRHLGQDYKVHLIESRCPQAMHIDTTFMPLGPKRVMINPEWVDLERLPPILSDWEILVAPRAVQGRSKGSGVMSSWINMNVLMLNETQVVVEEQQKPMIEALRSWGFDPIPCPFADYYPFFGSFHCATLDIRRG